MPHGPARPTANRVDINEVTLGAAVMKRSRFHQRQRFDISDGYLQAHTRHDLGTRCNLLVIVDDRSTDGTGAIAEAIAARDARVRVEHVSLLPTGWLGKVYALQRGVERASGEWLLFSDADVHFAPGTLRRAIAYLESEHADHLSVMPELRPRTFLVGVVQAAFLRLAVAGGRLATVADPHSSAAVGGGLFSLVRRAALEGTPGFEWLRLEVIDDLALGQMLKTHGAHARVVNAAGSVWLDFYPSVSEFVRGGEKNSFGSWAASTTCAWRSCLARCWG
jgi:cellulose synthase/poly-beta-1,6-N-acetylglucosamine synthase-like glycosyltransferase